MLLTRTQVGCFVSIFILSGAVSAKTNSDCLKHLGGGYGDAQCYRAMSVDLLAENEKLYRSVRATIPARNDHAMLLDEYVMAANSATKFCSLQRDAGAKWEKSPDGSMFPALYEQCIYEARVAQNKFLRNLSDMAKW